MHSEGGGEVTRRTKWLVAIALVLALALGGRMVLRYLDYQASEAERQQAGSPLP